MRRLLCGAAVLLAVQAYADDVAEAKKVNEAFIAAANVADPAESVKAVSALFIDDMHHIGAFGVVNSKAELQQIIGQAFKDPARKNELLSNEGKALDKDTVLTLAHFKTWVTGPEGKPMPLTLRCTRVMRKQKDGAFLIAAEHTSFGPPAPAAPPAK